MSKIAMVIGALLVALGVGTYLAAEEAHRSLTAFIPALFGVIFIILGVLAQKPGMKKHAMHAGAAIALAGFLMAGIRGAMKVGDAGFNLAIGAQFAMSALCLLFVLLAVRSFIAARKAREAAGAV